MSSMVLANNVTYSHRELCQRNLQSEKPAGVSQKSWDKELEYCQSIVTHGVGPDLVGFGSKDEIKRKLMRVMDSYTH